MKTPMLCCMLAALSRCMSVFAAVELERPASIPPRFEVRSPSSPRGTPMSFFVALQRQNLPELEQVLLAASDPAHLQFRQWWSLRDVARRAAPLSDHRETVRAWLTGANITCQDYPGSLKCYAPVESVESLLRTRVSHYFDSATGRDVHRVSPGEPMTIPAHLEGKVLFLTQVYTFPLHVHFKTTYLPPSRGGSARELQSDYMVGLESIQALYGLAGVSSSAASSVGPVEFGDNPAVLLSDNSLYAQWMGAPQWNISTIIGPFAGSDGESTLDEQLIGGIAQGSTQWFWTESSSSSFVYEWSEAVLLTPSPSSVFSISWGYAELLLGHSYVTEANNNLMLLGLAGITVVAASGDQGAHSISIDPYCTSPVTVAEFPASSPWVLSVGATQLIGESYLDPSTSKSIFCKAEYCAGPGTEVMASTATGASITSGGGFSTYATQPSYQVSAVSVYLKSGAVLPPHTDFNAKNRGYPDVSAVGHNIATIQNGYLETQDGTSASAPIWAAIIACANSALLASGLPVVGFVNPALYAIAKSTPTALNDINCAGCVNFGDESTTSESCSEATGFGTAVGWDAATGLGTPNAPVLIASLMARGTGTHTLTKSVTHSASSTHSSTKTSTASRMLSSTSSSSKTASKTPSASRTHTASSTGLATKTETATKSATGSHSNSRRVTATWAATVSGTHL